MLKPDEPQEAVVGWKTVVQTKPIERAGTLALPRAVAPNEANFGESQVGSGKFQANKSRRRVLRVFPLREETPCGVTTNTAGPCETKPIGRAGTLPPGTVAPNEANWQRSFKLEVASGKGTQRTHAQRVSPRLGAGVACETKPISGVPRPPGVARPCQTKPIGERGRSPYLGLSPKRSQLAEESQVGSVKWQGNTADARPAGLSKTGGRGCVRNEANFGRPPAARRGPTVPNKANWRAGTLALLGAVGQTKPIGRGVSSWKCQVAREHSGRTPSGSLQDWGPGLRAKQSQFRASPGCQAWPDRAKQSQLASGDARPTWGCRAKRNQLARSVKLEVASVKCARRGGGFSESSLFTLPTWLFPLATDRPAAIAPNEANCQWTESLLTVLREEGREKVRIAASLGRIRTWVMKESNLQPPH